MSDIRTLRLQEEYDAIRRLAHLHPRVTVEGVRGNPPEHYRVTLHVRSILEKDGEIEPVETHTLEIRIPKRYPSEPPALRLLTPVFHPNIAPQAVCIGDHWSPSESLDLMIQRVGEMLAFQSYNTKSPLNGLAARWVDENLDRLPLDKEEFFKDLDEAEAAAEHAVRRCSNCGAEGSSFSSCAVGHDLCSDCQARCPTCSTMICLTCGVGASTDGLENACSSCGQLPADA